MRIKVYVIELSARAKRNLILGGSLVILAATALPADATPQTFNAGDPLSAATMNANFADLQTQITATAAKTHAASGFRAELTNTTTVGGSTPTTVIFNSVQFDLASEYDTQNGVFTAAQAGTYLVTCGFEFPSSDTHMYAAVLHTFNGAELGANEVQAGQTGGGIDASTTGVYQLAAGASIVCDAYQDTSASVTLNTVFPHRNYFSAVRLY